MVSRVINVLEKKKLGDLMIQSGIVTESQLQEALEIQKQTGGKLGQILTQMGHISEELLLAFLGKQCGVNYVSLAEYGDIPEEVVRIIPENIVRNQTLIPIAKEGTRLIIAMSDPLNVFTVDDLKLISGYDIEVVISSEVEIKQVIDKYLGSKGSIEELIKDIEKSGDSQELEIVTEEEISTIEAQVDESYAIKIVNFILTNVIRLNASDIHIEPGVQQSRIRYRINGILQEQYMLPKNIQNAVISRLKSMAQLNISEHKIPQQGKMKIRVGDKQVDLEISTIPTVFGEKIVVNIPNTDTLWVDLNKLDFEPETLSVFKRNIKSPCGMILIVGPAGSGKFTTLYSTLAALNYPDRNIVTVEDSIKFVLPGINQVQVGYNTGLNFVTGLHSVLQQNPDMVMISELHDIETVRIAINAALINCLVFSTLNTNDTVGAITMLNEMGIEPFLLASALVMIVSQRLVRTICDQCKESYEIPYDVLANLGIKPAQVNNKSKVMIYRSSSKGCPNCGGTGYSGRSAVYELLEMNEGVKELVLKRAPAYLIKRIARKTGMKTLRESTMTKVLAGITTIEEMLRVTSADVEE